MRQVIQTRESQRKYIVQPCQKNSFKKIGRDMIAVTIIMILGWYVGNKIIEAGEYYNDVKTEYSNDLEFQERVQKAQPYLHGSGSGYGVSIAEK